MNSLKNKDKVAIGAMQLTKKENENKTKNVGNLTQQYAFLLVPIFYSENVSSRLYEW